MCSQQSYPSVPHHFYFCPKCGEHWITHSESGACPQDAYDEKKEAIDGTS